ncbi:TPA: rhomboid family intramembrane serine protease [Stenotrophomonas maltophilia]|nr:rhomboid family intramembrane serine protease [Stenotrophomonas maltophilia]
MTVAELPQSVFQHAGLAHLVGNAAVLAVVGPRVMRALGCWRIAALFLVAGVAGNGVAALLLHRQVIGASGAVAGVMAAYLVLFPRSRLALLISLWIALQFVFAMAAFDFGGVAWPAHIVGAAVGSLGAVMARATK